MKCKACNGTGYVTACVYESDEIGFVDKNYECAVCHGTGHIEQTNDEWRRTCSTEEFAEWISNLAYACMRCGMSNGEAYCYTGYCIQDEEDAVEWLKQPHRKVKND